MSVVLPCSPPYDDNSCLPFQIHSSRKRSGEVERRACSTRHARLCPLACFRRDAPQHVHLEHIGGAIATGATAAHRWLHVGDCTCDELTAALISLGSLASTSLCACPTVAAGSIRVENKPRPMPVWVCVYICIFKRSAHSASPQRDCMHFMYASCIVCLIRWT